MGKGSSDDQCRVALDPSAAGEPGAVSMTALTAQVAAGAGRVAELGQWPHWIAPESLTERVPRAQQRNAPGFDAGMACALDLIPRDRQELAARLHAAYTPAAVAQVRDEVAAGLDSDAPTTWWLAACSVCREGEVDEHVMRAQLDEFRALAADPAARQRAAQREYEAMTSRFWVQDGVAFGVQDGCQQGAYIAGHRFAAMGPQDPVADSDSTDTTFYTVHGHAKRADILKHGLRGTTPLFDTLAAARRHRLAAGGDIYAAELDGLTGALVRSEHSDVRRLGEQLPAGRLRLLTTDSGLYFIGTYEDSLGLEDFLWGQDVPEEDRVDEYGRDRSGGVHGSRQFVKTANHAEYLRAIELVKQRLGF